MKGIDIRITENDIEALGRKENAVKLSDEQGGYAVLVNAYHELHCIVRLQQFFSASFFTKIQLLTTFQKLLRQNMYPDYFYKEGDNDAGASFREHHVGKSSRLLFAYLQPRNESEYAQFLLQIIA